MMENTIKKLKKEAEFQDDRTAKGGSYRKFGHLIREEYPSMISAIGNVEGKRILTMGCSTGGVTPFAKKGAWALGIDISQLSVQEHSKAITEQKLSLNAKVITMDCQLLGIKDEVFDMVLFFGSLHHLATAEAMSETYRVLKPGGEVFLSEPLGLHPFVNLYRLLTPNLRSPYEHPLKPNDFKIMKKRFYLRQFKGFCLISILSLVPLYLLKSNKLYELVREFFIKIDDLLFTVFPFLRYFAWSAVIVLEKRKNY